MECNCLFYYRLFIVAHNQCEAPSKKIVSLIFLLFFSLKKKNYIWKRQIMWETMIKKKYNHFHFFFYSKPLSLYF